MLDFNKSPKSFTNHVPRFIEPDSDYTANFGFQWNKFSKTQIDNSENELSRERLFAQTLWPENGLAGKDVLEAGSGAGRFSEVILKYTKANLYSFDYSNAVEANYKTNGHYGERFKIFQASIYDIPFRPGQFDEVICLGVLQHTPDFKKSVEALCSMVKPGGHLMVDFYSVTGWWSKLTAKYFFRPITTKWSHEKLLQKIDNNVDWMIRLSGILQKMKLGVLRRFLPIVDIYNILPHQKLNKAELRDWCVLDTFDMFSPAYDNPQRIETVANWVKNAGMDVTYAGFVHYGNGRIAVVRATKR